MYYMLHCLSPDKGDLAMLTYKRDHPFRSWASGNRFSTAPEDTPPKRAPAEPIRAEIKPGYSGVMAEFWANPVPLMTKRLHKALLAAGVDNLDVYQAEILDKGKVVSTDYVAFNIIGKIAAADLKKSKVDPSSTTSMVSVNFNGVVIDPAAAHETLMFRLAESVNAIVVHEKVKDSLLAQGIHTLTFVPPEKWAG